VGAECPAATWEPLQNAGVAIVLTWCGDERVNSVTVDNEKREYATPSSSSAAKKKSSSKLGSTEKETLKKTKAKAVEN
jgi:hypothetical protein